MIKPLTVLFLATVASACPLCSPTGPSELVIILDRSGSMESIKLDMEGGLKAYLDGLTPDLSMGEMLQILNDGRGPKYDQIPNVTLIRFDDQIEVVHESVWLPKIQDITIDPRGNTALLDAIGTTLDRVCRHQQPRSPRTIVVIITDGLENASTVYTREQVFAKIDHLRKHHGWEFVFLGANQDAFAEASGLGIGYSIDLDHVSIDSGFVTLTAATSGFLATGTLVIADPNGTSDE